MVKYLWLTLLFFSCRKLLTVSTPADELPADAVYGNETQADAAIADIYYTMGTYYNGNMLPLINGMTADEGTSLNAYYLRYVNNSFPADDPQINQIWRGYYQTIYRCNAALEGLSQSGNLPAHKVAQWKGEAFFMRAFCYYYLVNCWGDVPLITSTDVAQSSLAYRSPVQDVNALIAQDLFQAMELLPVAYPGTERVRANKYAADALMARTALQQHDPAMAAIYATMVIESGMYTINKQDSAFLYNSPQAILQIWTSDGYTLFGQTFLPLEGQASYYPLTTDMVNTFEEGDLRRSAWTRSFTYSNDIYYYPYKYKKRVATTTADKEYLMLFRLPEMYLIRAEARVQQQDYNGAMADLNIIRHYAGLNNLSLYDSVACMQAVIQERRAELFYEWGDRWLTLKRTNTTDAILGTTKTYWKSYAALYPIPAQERERDPNLTQNTGY